jgi:hypothetical protein
MITPKSRSINSSNSFKKRPKNFDWESIIQFDYFYLTRTTIFPSY